MPLKISKTFLYILVSAAAAFGYRPFITDDAGTVVPVTFELETAADYWSDNATFGISLKHGITERMDIGVAFGRCVLPQDRKGYDPAELLLKFNLIPEHLSASFGGSFGHSCYSLNLIYSRPISIIECHANLGFSTESTPEEGFATFAVAAIVPVQQFSFGIECGGTQDALDWWQFGTRFAITDAIAVDAGIGSSISADDLEWNATSGLFFAFPPSSKE